MTLKRLHRLNALVLSSFLVLHLSNHLAILGGAEAHLAVMGALRAVYRPAVIETGLITLFSVQIVLGIGLILKRGRPRGRWAWAQVLSGGYLGFFLVQHLAAILQARWAYPELETNTWFAAAVVSRAPFVWYFAPYYALAILALFTHVAAALRFRVWPAPPGTAIRALPVIGAVLGLSIVAGLIVAARGLPPAYAAYLDGFGF